MRFKASLFALGLFLLMPTSPLFGQAFVPQQKIPKVNLDRIQLELQQELERAFGQFPGEFQPNGRRLDMDAMRWGGVQLKKVTPELQQKLGLPENEGLLVVAVDANSAGAAAGLKANDVLVKINTKAVPSDANGLSKLLTEQKANEPLELVVLRDGKEETLKGARMPTLLQVGPILGPGGVRPGIVLPPPIRIDLNRRLPMINPLQPGTITNLHIEMNVNGAKIIRDQKGDQFSGEYSKDDLKITVSGKIENGQGRATEITVTQGKETTKYANLKDVPAQHQRTLQQLMPSPLQNMMIFPMLPDFPPGILPVFPEFER